MFVPSAFSIEMDAVSLSSASGGEARISPPQLFDCLSLRICKGEFVALSGVKGSGKSTLARLLNGMQLPACGVVRINGMETHEKSFKWEIRRTVGMLFPEPDNQIIGTTVAEDVAFGPENLGLASDDIKTRVEEALRVVCMIEYADSAPHLLNGIRKLKIALAGVLAMRPTCIVVDESTAGLDAADCRNITQLLRKLNLEWGVTVLFMTTLPDETVAADRRVVLHKGRIICDEAVVNSVTPC